LDVVLIVVGLTYFPASLVPSPVMVAESNGHGPQVLGAPDSPQADHQLIVDQS
jgi:hypothetical protein